MKAKRFYRPVDEGNGPWPIASGGNAFGSILPIGHFLLAIRPKTSRHPDGVERGEHLGMQRPVAQVSN